MIDTEATFSKETGPMVFIVSDVEPIQNGPDWQLEGLNLDDALYLAIQLLNSIEAAKIMSRVHGVERGVA